MVVKMNVSQGAQSKLGGKLVKSQSNLNQSLSEYVMREYPALTNQQPAFYSVPAELQEPVDKGEKAEFEVFSRLKTFAEVLGLSMILFCGNTYSGRKMEDTGLFPKEVDFIVFLAYKNTFKVFMLEVKGTDAQVKKISTIRRHALTQLHNHKEIFGYEFQLPKATLDKMTEHVVWPNLQHTEYCESCKTEHRRFIRKPEKCKNRGSNASKMTDGNDESHLFDDTFNMEWLEKLMQSEDGCLNEQEWKSSLLLFLLMSAGALFDEMDKTFVLLSKEQMRTLHLPKHPMGQPRLIYGPAGSGKTLVIIAKIQELIQNGEVDENNKILYMCENRDVQAYVKMEVEKRQTNCSNLMTKTLSDISTEKENLASMFNPLIEEFSYIFIDEAEDWSPELLNKIALGALTYITKIGIFWILFDHIQSSSLNAGYVISNSGDLIPPEKNVVTGVVMERAPTLSVCEHRCMPGLEVTQVQEQIFEKDGEYNLWEERTTHTCPIKLCDCTIKPSEKETCEKLPLILFKKVYRSSVNCHSFLKEEPLISMFDPQVIMGHGILGPEKEIKDFHVKNRRDLQSEQVKQNIIRDICSEVMKLTGSQGVHPGDIAVTFDDFDFQTLFGVTKVPDLVHELNEHTLKYYEYNEKSKKRVPQSSSMPDESILKPHQKSTDCDCKYFVGPYRKLKGLTVKVIILITVQGRTTGYNRVAVYTAVSRTSCKIILFNVKVLDMSMMQYQTERMNFDKEIMKDEGHDRAANYTFYNEVKNKKVRSVLEVMYVRPDGTCDSDKTISFPSLNILGNSISGPTIKTFLRKLPNYEPSPPGPKVSRLDFSYAVTGQTPPNDQKMSSFSGAIYSDNK